MPGKELCPSALFSGAVFYDFKVGPRYPPVVHFGGPSYPGLFGPDLSIPSPVPTRGVVIELFK